MTRKLRLPLAAALALAFPALAAPPQGQGDCPQGKVKVRDECRDACPTTGGFAQPAACECPAGFSKILLGSGSGECRPVATAKPAKAKAGAKGKAASAKAKARAKAE